MTDRTPAELFPVIEFVREEMDEREWDDEDLIEACGWMSDEHRLSMEIFLACDPREMGVVLMGENIPYMLEKAFGISAQFWKNIEKQYYDSKS